MPGPRAPGRRAKSGKWLSLAIAIGIAYFVTAWLSFALLAVPGSVPIFWPASGLAVGALIVLGPKSRLPIAAGVVAASIVVYLMEGGNAWSAPAFALCNAGEVVLAAWLLERWFGPGIKLEDLSQVLGLFLAAGIGAGLAAVAATAASVLFGQSMAQPFTTWHLWFAAHALGVVTVAPVLIGLTPASRQGLEARELTEGAVALVAVAVASALVFTLPPGPWSVFAPDAVLLPLLLWLAARCRPVFAAAAAFVIALAPAMTTIHSIGAFGDPRFPLPDRLFAAQSGILTAVVAALVLAALFAARRQHDAALEASERRLRSILEAANVVAWEVDLTRDLVHATGPEERFLERASRQISNVAAAANNIHPADRDRVLAEFQAALQGGARCSSEFRILLADGSVRWLASEGTVVRATNGRPQRVLGVSHDITKTRETKIALQNSNRLLDSVIENLPAMVFMKRASDLRFVRLNRAGEELLGYSRSELLGKTDYDFFTKEQADFFTMVDRELLASDAVREISEEPIRTRHGDTRYLKTYKIGLRDASGVPTHVLGVSLDITENKEREERIRLLMREISHRAKNLLSVVQVMARRTAGEVDAHVFAERFGDRLAGLAASQDLLVKSDWRGAEISDLVRSQLAHFGNLIGTRVTWDGPSLWLRPAAAQNIGMALHELATNAAKYGALSDDKGCVRIEWDIVDAGEQTCFEMRWSERGGPAPEPPKKRGFGHTVMVEMLMRALDAEVRLMYPSSGVVWELAAPLEWVVAGAGFGRMRAPRSDNRAPTDAYSA